MESGREVGKEMATWRMVSQKERKGGREVRRANSESTDSPQQERSLY